jgi:O-antigen/teichoic acid export membrane protein
VVFVALQGTRRMLALAHLDNAQELVRVFLVVLGAMITGSAKGAVLGEIASRVFSSIIAVAIYSRARQDGGPPLPSLREVLRHIPEIPLRQGAHLAFRVGILKNASSLFLNVFPRLLIGITADMKAVGYFHVAQRIMGLPLMLMQGVSRTILPALSEMAGLKDLTQFRRLYTRTSLLAGGLISAGILLSLPLIPPLMRVFYPSDFERPVFIYAAIMTLGYIPLSFAVGLESFYIVTDKLRVSLSLSLLGCIVTIPANFLLIRALPVTGAVWGLSFYMSWVLVHFVYVAYYFRREARREGWK